MVALGLLRTQGVGDHDVQIRAQEREVVVAAIPEDQVRLGLGGRQDPGIVDPGEQQVPGSHVRLVLFTLFQGAVGSVNVLDAGEPLNLLRRQLTIGHGMAQDRHSPPAPARPAP